MTKYNGWTNYATWRVNLEVFDGLELSDVTYRPNYSDVDTYEVSRYCQEYVEGVVIGDAEGLVADYAMAFISDVNWYEIAEHLIKEYEHD